MSYIKKDVDEVMAFAVMRYMLRPLSEFEGYTRNLFNDKGEMLRTPLNQHEEHISSLFIRTIVKLKHLARGRDIELAKFIHLKSFSIDASNNTINALQCNGIHKAPVQMYKTLNNK